MVCAAYLSPVGRLVLGAESCRLVRLWLPGLAPEGLHWGEDPALERAAAALDCYFDGGAVPDDLPLSPEGTEFQRSVWALLREIPGGEVRTYGELARRLGRPGAARAVGQACNRNPIPILIPCHRVVGRGGSLTGYAGGTALKAELLAFERKNF